MADTPFPLPRQTRESTILVGNGSAGPYGPSLYKIFDIEDVTIWTKASGATFFTDVTASCTVTKTNGDPYDTFSVTFWESIPASTEWYHSAKRVSERSVAVTRAGSIDAPQLEKELSKQATTLSEIRRDLGRTLQVEPGQPLPLVEPLADGHFSKWQDGQMVDGGSADDIINAQANAALTAADRVQTGLDRTAAAASADAAAEILDRAVPNGHPSLDSTTDWNDIAGEDATGWYDKLLGPSNSNSPKGGGYFFCQSTRYNNKMTQIAYPYATTVSNGVYIRGQNNTDGWDDWHKLSYSDDFPTDISVTVATRTALKALNKTTITSAFLKETGREGQFFWVSSNLSGILLGTAKASSAVDSITETITSNGHGLLTGNAVVATSAVNGLSTNTLYYVIYVDANNFKLALSHANAVAGTAFNLTGTSAVTFKQHFDPEEIVFVCPTSDISGASGADVRQYGGVELLPEWAGAVKDDTSIDNRRYFDALVVLSFKLNITANRWKNGVYTFKSSCNPIGFGLFVLGGGMSSSSPYGGTVFARDYNGAGPEDALITWDGHLAIYNATGGGFIGGTVRAENGTSGGAGIKAYATSDNYRPGYWGLDQYAIIGTGTGTFAQPLTIDGSNCTTSGAQGIRDLFIGRGIIGAATSNSIAMNNVINTVFGGTEVFQAAGSIANILISGADGTATKKSTNIVGVVNVDGTLSLNNATDVALTGRADTVTIAAAAANCLFDGAATNVTNNSTTSRVITPTKEFLPSGQSGSGFTRLPGNKILAWGSASLNTSAANVSCGVTFSGSPTVTLTVENGTAAYAFVTGRDSTSFNAAVSAGSGITVMWQAVGNAP